MQFKPSQNGSVSERDIMLTQINNKLVCVFYYKKKYTCNCIKIKKNITIAKWQPYSELDTNATLLCAGNLSTKNDETVRIHSLVLHHTSVVSRLNKPNVPFLAIMYNFFNGITNYLPIVRREAKQVTFLINCANLVSWSIVLFDWSLCLFNRNVR